MTDRQFLRFRKQYERKQKEECKPHRGFYPNGFANYIKFIIKRKKMYERKERHGNVLAKKKSTHPQLALPAPDMLGDVLDGNSNE